MKSVGRRHLLAWQNICHFRSGTAGADDDQNQPALPSWLAGNPFASVTPDPQAPSAPNAIVPPPAANTESPDVTAVKNRMWAEEAGHRHLNPDGQPLRSPAGAIGYSQVMPGTGPEAAKLAGLPWDEERLKTD